MQTGATWLSTKGERNVPLPVSTPSPRTGLLQTRFIVLHIKCLTGTDVLKVDDRINRSFEHHFDNITTCRSRYALESNIANWALFVGFLWTYTNSSKMES
ncbi:hypothetical protein Mapa_015603 [Marchantia paleacea]|nr:hypothetical protein Mapa_015603 [Marchantia paleacea]